MLVEERAARLPRERDVVVGDLGPLRLRHLHRVVQQVTGDHDAFVGRCDLDRGMSGRVPWCRHQAQAVAEIGIGRDDVGEPGREDRIDRVHVHRRGVRARRGAPVVELVADVEVARVRERRLPLAVGEVRVPADVVLVQVRVQDEVDRVGRDTRFGEALEPRRVQLVPERECALLGVADTRIHKGDVPRLLDQECLDAERDGAVGSREPLAQPLGVAHRAGGRVREEQLGGNARRLLLDDGSDGRVADGPALGHARPYAGCAARGS